MEDLVRNPGTTPFSRLKYIARQPEDEVVQFLNGLFNLAAEAKDSGDWRAVEEFLEGWEETLTQRLNPPRAYHSTPWTPFNKPLGEARLAVLTTGGVYVEGQEPFDVNGDWSYRAVPKDTPAGHFRVAHTHYDTTGVAEDVNCVFPIQRLREMERQGLIGSMADVNYSFMGYIPDPTGLINDTAPEVAWRLREEGVDGAVIGTT
jgi:D-proline reductase (dithiol) PrdB